jgi:hypothetical protein
MVHYQNFFSIQIKDEDFIHHLIYSFENFLKSTLGLRFIDHYTIETFTKENDFHWFRKANIKKHNIFEYIPEKILSKFPHDLIDACYSHTEETTFLLDKKVIIWKIYPQIVQDLFSLYGETMIQSIDNSHTKVEISIHFEFNPKINIKSIALRFLLFRIVEKQIPYLIFCNMKDIYQTFAHYIKDLPPH